MADDPNKNQGNNSISTQDSSQADPLAKAYDYENDKKTVPVPEIPAKPQPTTPDSSSKIKPPPQSTPETTQTVGTKAIIKRGRSRITKIIIGILIVIALSAGIFYFFFYQATIIINPTPTPDQIILDGKEIEAGTYRIKPGRHKLYVKKEGYVSYVLERELKMAQKITLDFAFKKQPEGKILAEGGSNIVLTSDKSFIIFQGKDGKLYSIKRGSDPAVEAISITSYPNIKEMLISENNLFAMILDRDALRVVNLLKQDLLSQDELKLPPLAQAISAVTWNAVTDSYFTEANAHIIYDLKTDYGWDLILANRQHTQSQILMQIDQDRFRNIRLDWGTNPKQVLIAGGELGIIDLPSRSYSEVLKEKDIVSAKWSPDGTKFAAISSEGQLYASEGEGATEIDVKGELFNWINDNQLAVVESGRLIVYSFDTKEVINYAEIKGLENCYSFAVVDNEIYFSDNQGVKSASLQVPDYQKEGF